MSQLLRSLLGTDGKTGSRSKPVRKKCWPELEALEDRSVPSATTLHHLHALPIHHHTAGIARQMATGGTTSTSNQTLFVSTGSHANGSHTTGSHTTGSHAPQQVTAPSNTGSHATGSHANGSHATGSHAPQQVTTNNTGGTSATGTALARHAARRAHPRHHA